MPQLLGKVVGPTGFGLMGITIQNIPEEQAFDAMRAALESGCNFWNGGEFYGPEDANSLVLLEKYFTKYPEDAGTVVLSVKGGGVKGKFGKWDSSPDNVRRSVNDCVEQLKGRAKIDMFEIARHDRVTPWAVTLKCLDEDFVQTGTLAGISLSEVRAETIYTAVKVAKIAAVEVELSLMNTDILTNGVAEACFQHNIPIIAYSPLGHGMLAGKLRTLDDVSPYLRSYPRYSPENFRYNLQLVDEVERFSKEKGCTMAQFAINWVRCQSKKLGMPTIIPIPGGSSAARVKENSKVVDITLDELAAIDAILAKFEVKGERYPEGIPVDD